MPSPMALEAATRVSSEAIGLGNVVGRLAAGMAAHVIAVPGDPLRDIEQLGNVSLVMQAGNIVFRSGSA